MIHHNMVTRADPACPSKVAGAGLTLPAWRRWLLLRTTGQGVDTALLPWALVPALTFVGVAWVTVIWLAMDRAPLFWDPADHISAALDFINHPLQYLSREQQWYPPLVHVLLGGALATTGYDLDTAIALVNMAFFAVLLAATFAIGNELWSSRVGAVAALLMAFYPATFVHLRFPMLDLPLTAMVAASVYALIRTRSFQNRRWCAVFGILAGLGCLIKQSYVFSLVFPGLWAAFTAPRSKQTLANVALAVLLVELIALPWYAPRIHWFLGPWADHQSLAAKIEGDPGTFTSFGLLYYLIGTWHQTSAAFALVWLVTLPLFLRSQRRTLVIVWWAGTVALVSLLVNKDGRYVMPALPAIALMTSVGLCRLPRPGFAVAAVAAFGVLQLWAVSFGVGWLPEGSPIWNAVHPDEPIQVFTQNYLLVSADRSQPDSAGWGVADGLADLRGYVGVIGDNVLYDAARLPHVLQAQRSGNWSTTVVAAACQDPRLPLFDLVVMQVGGAGSPTETGDYDHCLEGMQEVGRIPVSTRNILNGVSYLALFRPMASPAPGVILGGTRTHQ